MIVIDFIVAAVFALEISPVALQTGYLAVREHAEKLGVLIGGDYIEILSFKDFSEFSISLAGLTLIYIYIFLSCGALTPSALYL